MNYYEARQLESGGYHYTCMNDGRIWPVGYCAGWREWTPEDRERFHMRDEDYARIVEHRDKYHTHTHATPEEAQECYRQYLLDQRTRYDGATTTQASKCEVCGVWTDRWVTIDGWLRFALCDEHRTREHVEARLTVGNSMES